MQGEGESHERHRKLDEANGACEADNGVVADQSHEPRKKLGEASSAGEADNGVVADQSHEPHKILDEVSSACEGGNGVVVEPHPSVVEGTSSLGPVTPDCSRENGEFLLDFKSPLTLFSSRRMTVHVVPPGIDGSISCNDQSPRTPKEGVFDPFAPGPEELAMAPLGKKHLNESWSKVARKLSFKFPFKFSEDENSDNSTDSVSDEGELLQSFYGNLLEAIVRKQSEGVPAEVSPIESDTNGFKTPTSAPRLSGVAETCPDAPMKSTMKLRNIDQGLCRKLEF